METCIKHMKMHNFTCKLLSVISIAQNVIEMHENGPGGTFFARTGILYRKLKTQLMGGTYKEHIRNSLKIC